MRNQFTYPTRLQTGLPHHRRWTLAVVVGLAGVLLLINSIHSLEMGTAQTVPRQRFQPDRVWQEVYERLPDFPRENQYVSVESRQVAPENTLVSRLIRYHVYVKGRSPLLRFDWKLTLADYLGVNEPIAEETYPSRATLRPSPYDADIAAIRRLDRAQRDALVQALVGSFTTRTGQGATAAPTPAVPTPAATPPVIPAPVTSSPQGPASGAGAAELLQPLSR